MDTIETKAFISYLMDLSDLAEKAKQEMRGIKASCRVLTAEEHEAIKELVIGIVSDMDVVDSDLQEYSRLGFIGKSFVARPQ